MQRTHVNAQQHSTATNAEKGHGYIVTFRVPAFPPIRACHIPTDPPPSAWPWTPPALRAKLLRWASENSFYQANYRDHVPHDMLMDLLMNANPPQEDWSKLTKWQGNAVAGVDCGQDGHVVFYPTGHVLQQACAWYSKGESEGQPSCSSTVIETGARIRQFVVMGSKDAYRSISASQIYAATRGTTNCTIVAAPSRVTPQNVRKMQAKAKISFSEMINHIAGSPHAEAELAIVTNGVVRCWDPEGGVRIVNKGFMNMADRVRRCEYSRYDDDSITADGTVIHLTRADALFSHPCVLWTANRVKVTTLDLRQPPDHTCTLFDLAGASAYITIYDVKRRKRNPFQFVVGTGVSVELMDSRMAKQPLISWIQPQSYSKSSDTESFFAAIDEVDLSRNVNDERGYIVSSLNRPKATTLFPFERNRKRRRENVMSLATLRSNGGDEYSMTPRVSTEQLIASDAPLDLHMEDGGEYTRLAGICALRNEDSPSASIYQLSTAGDLRLSNHISCRLPCGVVAQVDPSEDSPSNTLPIAMDAIIPELDTESLQKFNVLAVKVLRRQFPRLPGNIELSLVDAVCDDNETKLETGNSQGGNVETAGSPAAATTMGDDRREDADDYVNVKAEVVQTHSESTSGTAAAVTTSSGLPRNFDKDELTKKILRVCDPSASLFQLHRYVLDKLKVQLSSTELLEILRTSSQKFRIRTVHQAFPADTYRVLNPSAPGADDIHHRKGDPRLATCTCRPGSLRSQSPCESWSCVMPHAIVVSSSSPELHLDFSAPASATNPETSSELLGIITAAREVYDRVYESGSESGSESE
ncbi:unnamed protein product [Phytophthora fragariaefolia]|uniref:Unnamed protein product n=1 Tax=Phytophthora fragariaefolia TaxID=1490495 RepID=A0A9W6WV39_9STRA|nr:unnamed protein product [Phytophthora fragariaefolia]